MARRRSARGSSRPRYQWIRETTPLTEVPNNSVLGLMEISDTKILAEALAAPTLVRVRGELFCSVDTVTVGVLETLRVGWGLIVVPSSVTALEVGGPLSSPNLEWMYWQGITLRAPDVAPVLVEPGFLRIDVDVKAMRKIHKASVHLVVENLTLADGHVFCSAGLSFLFQE